MAVACDWKEPAAGMFVIYAMLAYGLVAIVAACIVLGRQRRRSRAHRTESFIPAGGLSPPEAHLLHTVTLRGRKLRFYRSPLIGPDFPWAVLRDLFAIATDGASYMVTAEWIYANNPALAQAILTGTGAELLLSHRAGQELLASLVTDPEEHARLAGDFRETMAEAYVLQWSGLSREEFLTLCAEAQRRPHAYA